MFCFIAQMKNIFKNEKIFSKITKLLNKPSLIKNKKEWTL